MNSQVSVCRLSERSIRTMFKSVFIIKAMFTNCLLNMNNNNTLMACLKCASFNKGEFSRQKSGLKERVNGMLHWTLETRCLIDRAQ